MVSTMDKEEKEGEEKSVGEIIVSIKSLRCSMELSMCSCVIPHDLWCLFTMIRALVSVCNSNVRLLFFLFDSIRSCN